MAQLVFADVATSIRTKLAERTDGQFINDLTGAAEVQDVMQEALNQLNNKLRFLRDTTTIDGTSYIASWGSNPFMYELPSTFHAIDELSGIVQNGIHRLEASERQYATLQAAHIAPVDTPHTVSTEDFFEIDFSGVIFHYFTRWVLKSEIDNSRSGYLCYFDPQLGTGTVSFNFIARHPDPNVQIYLPEQFKSLLVHTACKLLSPKFVNAGRASPEMPRFFAALANEDMAIAEEYFNQKPRKSRILGPRDRGMYGSARGRATAGGRRYDQTE